MAELAEQEGSVDGLGQLEPSHGYDLKRDYDAYFGRGKQLPFGQVYSTLGRLARDGKVVGGEAEPGDGPDRRRYAITDAGRAEVDAWLADPVEPEPHLQTVLFAKVTLALLLGKPAAAYLDKQRSAHIRRMQELTELRRNSALIDVLLADHAFQANASQPCWSCTTGTPVPSPLPSCGELWNNSADFYQGQTIRRLDVASLGADAPVLPGITRSRAPPGSPRSRPRRDPRCSPRSSGTRSVSASSRCCSPCSC